MRAALDCCVSIGINLHLLSNTSKCLSLRVSSEILQCTRRIFVSDYRTNAYVQSRVYLSTSTTSLNGAEDSKFARESFPRNFTARNPIESGRGEGVLRLYYVQQNSVAKQSPFLINMINKRESKYKCTATSEYPFRPPPLLLASWIEISALGAHLFAAGYIISLPSLPATFPLPSLVFPSSSNELQVTSRESERERE